MEVKCFVLKFQCIQHRELWSIVFCLFVCCFFQEKCEILNFCIICAHNLFLLTVVVNTKLTEKIVLHFVGGTHELS